MKRTQSESGESSEKGPGHALEVGADSGVRARILLFQCIYTIHGCQFHLLFSQQEAKIMLNVAELGFLRCVFSVLHSAAEVGEVCFDNKWQRSEQKMDQSDLAALVNARKKKNHTPAPAAAGAG